LIEKCLDCALTGIWLMHTAHKYWANKYWANKYWAKRFFCSRALPRRATLLPALLCLVLMAPMLNHRVQAHTMVQSVSIKNGAVLSTPPSEITVTFEHPARFGSVQLTTLTGERVALDYQLPDTMQRMMSVALPKLAPDRYRFSWRVIAQDGHVMAGSVNFSIAP
jgi:copper resistance protein C